MSTREPERLLTFEIAGHIYALPIDGILEVAEGSEPSVVPTLSAAHAGVMNWHGEALPVVAGQMLLEATSPPDGETIGWSGRPRPEAVATRVLLSAAAALRSSKTSMSTSRVGS